MNSFKTDKGRQVVFGVDPKKRHAVIFLGELKRNKNQTAEAALKEWAATSDRALQNVGVTCVVATLDTDRYKLRVRKVADIEVVNETLIVNESLGE